MKLLVFTALGLALASTAQSADRIFVGSVVASWMPATGPVQAYQLDRLNDGETNWSEVMLMSPEGATTLTTPLGVAFNVRVRAVDTDGGKGPLSDSSLDRAIIVADKCERKPNGVINAGEIAYVAMASMLPGNWDLRCDLNGNGKVDTADLALLANAFGSYWCVAPSGRTYLAAAKCSTP